jgi:Dolichyl-phosphate-mannose-protein mannosyltransferase
MGVLKIWRGAKPAILATAAGRGLCFNRSDPEAFWDRLSFAVFTIAAVLVLLTFRDYGVTWDEDVHNWYGNLVLDYYLSWFSDKSALHWRDLYNYGALFDSGAAALNRLSPLGIYETRHLLGGCVGILGLIGCWKLAREIAGARAGLIAVLFLILTPNYYGQMFNNPKDVPFAVASVWATYYMVRIIPTLPRPPLRQVCKLGLAIGMAMGVRIGGLLLLCYLGLLLGTDGIGRAMAVRRLAALFDTGRASLCRVVLPVVLLAYLVMLLFWPWAQIHPIENPLRALEFFSHQTFPFYTLFAGQFVPATDLPWAYLPTYILIALPELVLVLLLCAPVAASVALYRHPVEIRREQGLAWFVLGIGIIFPVAYAIAIRAVLFDGMRHFIFVLPLIAVVAALVADHALDRLAQFRYRRPVYIAFMLYGCAHLSITAMLHPDQYVYYNAFVGGTEGAQRKFKLDYWANSYAEAVRGLEGYLQAEYAVDFEDREFTVAVCGPPISADYFFPPNFRFTRRRDEADFFVAFTKDNCDRSLPGRPIYRVERMGTLLSVVLDRRNFLAEGPNVEHAGTAISLTSHTGSAVR